MTRAREWQVSLDFKARLDEDAAFDLMEALGRYGASVAVDPGHTGGGLTLAVDAPDGETALDKALTHFRLRFFFLKEEMAIMCVRSTGIRL